MAEEALLGALEGAAGGGLGRRVVGVPVVGDARGLERRVEVGVDDLERAGAGVVDVALRGRDGVLDDVALDTGVAERAGLVEPQGLEVAGDDLAGGAAAGLHRGDELLALLERVRSVDHSPRRTA